MIDDWSYALRAAARIEGAEERYDKIIFRCPICGDSKTHRNKKRGAFVQKEDGVAFVCKNNPIENSSLSWFLHEQMPDLYEEYRNENFKERGRPDRFEAPTQTASDITGLEEWWELLRPRSGGRDNSTADQGDKGLRQEEPEGTAGNDAQHPQSRFAGLERIIDLRSDHVGVKFARSRGLHKSRAYSRYLFHDYFGVWAAENDETKKPNEAWDPRIILPCINADGTELGGQGRGVANQKLRYLSASFGKDRTLCYGLDLIDISEEVQITEGAFDADALPNGVAALHGDLSAFAEKIGLDRDQAVLYFDNEKGHKVTRDLALKAARADWQIAVWREPQWEIGKDPAEMVFERGLNVASLVEVKRGLAAELALARWIGKI